MGRDEFWGWVVILLGLRVDSSHMLSIVNDIHSMSPNGGSNWKMRKIDSGGQIASKC